MNRLQRPLVALLATALASCATLFGPRTVTVSEGELRERIAARFPIERRVLDVLDLHLESPQLTLKPDVNRIEVALDLRLDERVSRRSFPTSIALDTALAYDATEAAVRMVDVRMRALRIDGLPAPLPSLLERMGTPVLEQMLEGAPVYRFTPEQLHSARGRGYQPDSIAVTPRGLEMRLVPLPGG